MGTWAHVVVHGKDAVAMAEYARDRIAHLEALWSRFRPDSQVSRANSQPGTQVWASPETVRLIACAAQATAEFAPYFDPCRLDAIVAWGYDRTFTRLGVVTAAPGDMATLRTPRGVLTSGTDWICVPAEGFDPGAIGKGMAADIVAEELAACGATGVMVNVGGDLRCMGVPPAELSSGSWSVAVTDDADVTRVLFDLVDGGVATSSTGRRHWITVEGAAHHVIDPRTSRPVQQAPQSVTVLSDRGWRSEVLATAVLVAGLDVGRTLVERAGCAAWVVDAGGGQHQIGNFHDFARSGAPTQEAVQ